MADIQWRMEERVAREREEEAQKQREEEIRGRRPGRRKHTQQRREWQKNEQGQIKVNINRGWWRGGHNRVITFTIQEGEHGQHIPDGLG